MKPWEHQLRFVLVGSFGRKRLRCTSRGRKVSTERFLELAKLLLGREDEGAAALIERFRRDGRLAK